MTTFSLKYYYNIISSFIPSDIVPFSLVLFVKLIKNLSYFLRVILQTQTILQTANVTLVIFK